MLLKNGFKQFVFTIIASSTDYNPIINKSECKARVVAGPLAYVWPANQSRAARDLISPLAVTSLLSPAAVCNSSAPATAPYLLVIVCSALTNFEARYTIRQSWAQDTDTLNNVKVQYC